MDDRIKVAWGRCWNDETDGETNTLHEVFLDAETKYDTELNYIMDRLKQNKCKRSAERVIIVISSLGAAPNDEFINVKKVFRNKGNRNEDKHAAVILCQMMVREEIEDSRIIWLRKCGFSIDFESKR
jgi:hypothetical protein